MSDSEKNKMLHDLMEQVKKSNQRMYLTAGHPTEVVETLADKVLELEAEAKEAERLEAEHIREKIVEMFGLGALKEPSDDYNDGTDFW